MAESVNPLDDIMLLMKKLREPETGCPWDIAQDWDDIIPHTLEEVYEVVDAVQSRNWPHIQEELGDLLFQIVFYAQMADEQGKFDLKDIIEGLQSKLIRRHPHVFPEGHLHSRPRDMSINSAQIEQMWQQIKDQEKPKAEGSAGGILKDIPLAMPAVTRAKKMQKKASVAGLDWPSAEPVFDVVRDELAELEQAIASGSDDQVADELGDVFFSLVNLSRHLKQDPETVMTKANLKFSARIEWIESKLKEDNLMLTELNSDALEHLWQLAKRSLNE